VSFLKVLQRCVRASQSETTMTDLSDRSFITRTGKPKFDWDLVLKGIDRHYRKVTTNKRRLALHRSMLEQVDFERDAYRDDIREIARTAHIEMEVIWADDPERDLIIAKNAASWRAECRSRMAWLGDVEEKLDAALVAAIEVARV
jgi:hypothetical protein